MDGFRLELFFMILIENVVYFHPFFMEFENLEPLTQKQQNCLYGNMYFHELEIIPIEYETRNVPENGKKVDPPGCHLDHLK